MIPTLGDADREAKSRAEREAPRGTPCCHGGLNRGSVEAKPCRFTQIVNVHCWFLGRWKARDLKAFLSKINCLRPERGVFDRCFPYSLSIGRFGSCERPPVKTAYSLTRAWGLLVRRMIAGPGTTSRELYHGLVAHETCVDVFFGDTLFKK